MARTGQRRSACVEPVLDELAIRTLLRAYPTAMVEESIDRAGCTDQRTRALPASLVVHFVMGLVVYPHLAYREVLQLVLRATGRPADAESGPGMVTSPALSHARRRLGVAVFEDLFRRAGTRLPTPEIVIPGPDCLRLVTATRAVIEAAARAEKLVHPRAPAAGSVRIGAHVLRDMPSGSIRAAGLTTAHRTVAEVWAGLSVETPGPTLVVADGLDPVEPSVPRLMCSAGNQLLWQSGSGFRFVPEKVLPDGSVLSRGDYRPAAPHDPGALFRVLDRNGRDPLSPQAQVEDRLMTTYLDWRAAPARLLAALHAATMPAARGFALRDSTFVPRSKDPAGVEQETWAFLLAQRAAALWG